MAQMPATIGGGGGRGCQLGNWKNFHAATRPLAKAEYELETNLASRWEGVRLPRASPEVPGLPRKFPKLPRKFFGDFPGSSLTVELYSNPGVPRKFPGLPRKFPGLPRKFPGLPQRSALSLGSLTPSPDSQKLSLNEGRDRPLFLLPS